MNNKISVVMGNYNCAAYIEEAINSLIAQTYKDWELIIVDDCSTDNSIEIIEKYRDSRIRLICSDSNQGLAVSLNKAISVADGNLIARLDPDDISYPDRFQKQVDFLLQKKEISVCGSNMELFGEVNGYVTKFPQESAGLMAYMPFNSPIPHSSWMINRVLFEDSLAYNPEFRSSQDYEFMYRLWKEKKLIACIKEPLVKYRVRNDSISGKSRKRRDANTRKIQKCVLEDMGIDISDENIDELNLDFEKKKGRVDEYIKYLKINSLLLKHNKGDSFFSQSELRKIIFKKSIVYGLEVIGLK